MTLEVFRSELTKRGFDDKQVAELEKMANIMQMLDDCHINRAYTAIFDSATKILTGNQERPALRTIQGH